MREEKKKDEKKKNQKGKKERKKEKGKTYQFEQILSTVFRWKNWAQVWQVNMTMVVNIKTDFRHISYQNVLWI
jgi:hypothetical protein